MPMSTKPVVVVTGASGFVGRALTLFLCAEGYSVRAMVRNASAESSLLRDIQKKPGVDQLSIYVTGELTEINKTPKTAIMQDCAKRYEACLKGADIVVHCAARAHKLSSKERADLVAFRSHNVDTTEQLVNAAVNAQVKRFIFISSIGVLGNSNTAAFTEETPLAAHSPYAQAKQEAEQRLMAIRGKMETVIIRPPLVYGADVKGNFARLIKLVEKGFPLPFACVNNKRHFVGLDNLVDFITLCLEAKAAANQVFVVADNESVSLCLLLHELSSAMQKRLVLLPVPKKLLMAGFYCLGQKKLAEQLVSNLEIDTNKAKTLLGWSPPYTFNQQLQKAVIKRYST